MKKKFAMKWADALESGKYKQAHEKLYDGKGYCCLGVVCILLGKKFIEKHEKYYLKYKESGEWRLEDALLPEPFLKKIGMKYIDGCFSNDLDIKKDGTQLTDLAALNDIGWSFKKIAKFIRKNYEIL